MDTRQRILSLRNSIDLLEAELDAATKQYLLDCEKDGITQEEYANHTFSVQANAPSLDIDKSNVPAELMKLTPDQAAVRKYLLYHGTQSWGALVHDKPFKLVIKPIALKA